MSWDKETMAAYQKKYYEEHKAEYLERQKNRSREYYREYYQKNKDRYKKYGQEHYQKNKARIQAKSKEWREANPERYRQATRDHWEKNREKLRVRSHEWYLQNKERASATNRLGKFRRYGLTEVEFMAMLDNQAGLCQICQLEMNPPVIDHSHKTGKVRGLLCRKCNVALGGFQDSPDLLMSAAVYLESSSSSGAISTKSNAA